MLRRDLSESVRTYYPLINRGHNIYVSSNNSQFVISPPWNPLNKVSYAKRERFFKGSIKTIVSYIKEIQKHEEPYALYYATHPDKFAKAPRYHISLDKIHSTFKQEISELEKIVDSEKEIRRKKVDAWDHENPSMIDQIVWAGSIPGTLLGLEVGIYLATEYSLTHQNPFNLNAELVVPALSTLLGYTIGWVAGKGISLIVKDHRINIEQELDILKRLKVDKRYKG